MTKRPLLDDELNERAGEAYALLQEGKSAGNEDLATRGFAPMERTMALAKLYCDVGCARQRAAVATTAQQTTRSLFITGGSVVRGGVSDQTLIGMPGLWQMSADSIAPRTYASAFATRDGLRVYQCGGLYNQVERRTDVCIFDVQRRSWSRGPSLPLGVANTGGAFLNGMGYVVGGAKGQNTVANEMWCLLIGLEPAVPAAWVRGKPMRTARHSLATAVAADSIVCIGGSNETVLDNVERFDTGAMRWTYMAPLPTPASRVAACASADGRVVFACGGRTLVANHLASLATCYRMDMRTGTWTTIAPMATTRCAAACAMMGETLYVSGGYDGSAQTASVEKYDTAGNAWSAAAPMPRAIDGHAMVVVEA